MTIYPTAERTKPSLKVDYVEWAEQRHLMSRDRSRNNQKVIPAVGLRGPVPDFILALTL